MSILQNPKLTKKQQADRLKEWKAASEEERRQELGFNKNNPWSRQKEIEFLTHQKKPLFARFTNFIPPLNKQKRQKIKLDPVATQVQHNSRMHMLTPDQYKQRSIWDIKQRPKFSDQTMLADDQAKDEDAKAKAKAKITLAKERKKNYEKGENYKGKTENLITLELLKKTRGRKKEKKKNFKATSKGGYRRKTKRRRKSRKRKRKRKFSNKSKKNKRKTRTKKKGGADPPVVVVESCEGWDDGIPAGRRCCDLEIEQRVEQKNQQLNLYRQTIASERQLKIQFRQERDQALQELNRIRPTLLGN